MLIFEHGVPTTARAMRPHEFDTAVRAVALTELERLTEAPALNLGAIADTSWLVLDCVGRLRVVSALYSPNATEFVAELAQAEQALHKTWIDISEGYYAGPDRFQADYQVVRGRARPGIEPAAWSHLLIIGSAARDVMSAARLISGSDSRLDVRILRALQGTDPLCGLLEPVASASSELANERMSVAVPTPQGMGHVDGAAPRPPSRLAHGAPTDVRDAPDEPVRSDNHALPERPDPEPAPGTPPPAPDSMLPAGRRIVLGDYGSAEPASGLEPVTLAPTTPEPVRPGGALQPARPAAGGSDIEPQSMREPERPMVAPIAHETDPPVSQRPTPLPLARLAAAMGGQSPIVWYWRQRGETYTALLLADGRIRLPDGSLFADPVAAAEAASGHLADGWRVWRIGERQRTLADALAEIYRAKK